MGLFLLVKCLIQRLESYLVQRLELQVLGNECHGRSRWASVLLLEKEWMVTVAPNPQ